MECLDIHNIHSIFTVYMDLAITGIISSPKIIVISYYHRTGHTLIRKVLWFSWMKKGRVT